MKRKRYGGDSKCRTRLFTAVLAVCIFLAGKTTVFACDPEVSEIYVSEVLFGADAKDGSARESTKLLTAALYLACEQCDGKGEAQLALVNQSLRENWSLSDLNLSEKEAYKCAHTAWAAAYSDSKIKDSRKDLLRKAVNHLFDFGILGNIFYDRGKCNSFAAFLYDLHILTDYLANDPQESEISFKDYAIEFYHGDPYVILADNMPEYSDREKQGLDVKEGYAGFDALGRPGSACIIINSADLDRIGPRERINMINPPGWNKDSYLGIVDDDLGKLYQRSHLIAHGLGGPDRDINLITGTQYFNQVGMTIHENDAIAYIRETGNSVVYRVTPIYEGNNGVAAGVQMEMYSVEDKGKGLCRNVYCYNIQPGISLDYATGDSKLLDCMHDNADVIPFAYYSQNQPGADLISEIRKHLEMLFASQSGSETYKTMMNALKLIEENARIIAMSTGKNKSHIYKKLKEYEFECFNVLRENVPLLLRQERFFASAYR